MRDVFINTLIDLAKENEKIVLLMAEVGYGVVEPFQQQFPKRFYNVGISEQNLVLTAAGMAIQGYRPVAYSMSSFLPTRAFEMIKDSVCYQNLPVTLVGIGSGVSYGKLGTTHHAVEESALMRVLPNMEVIFPADGDGCCAALKYALQSDKPTYIGLEKMRSQVYNYNKKFSLQWEKVEYGKDAAIFACGNMFGVAIEAAEALQKSGIAVCVYKVEVVKPLDYAAVEDACDTKNIFVLDEHSIICGIGAQIAEYIMSKGYQRRINNFKTIAIPDEYPDKVWDEMNLRELYALCSEKIVEEIRNHIA